MTETETSTPKAIKNKEAVVAITNLKIDRALNKADQHIGDEKGQAIELYIEKLLRKLLVLALLYMLCILLLQMSTISNLFSIFYTLYDILT